MTLTRRSFLSALFVAPAIVRPGLLMPINPSLVMPAWLPVFPDAFRLFAPPASSHYVIIDRDGRVVLASSMEARCLFAAANERRPT